MPEPGAGQEEGTYQHAHEATDQLHDLLIESYAKGYARAVDDHEVDFPDPEASEYVKDCGYYEWEGATIELENWIREQFAGDSDE